MLSWPTAIAYSGIVVVGFGNRWTALIHRWEFDFLNQFFGIFALHDGVIGDPGMAFLVSLDIGSDLFWVPCDCSRCTPTEGTDYASDFELSIYNNKGSSTSKKVTCNSSLCTHRNRCLGIFQHFPVHCLKPKLPLLRFSSRLHSSREGSHQELIEAYITFGCGQVQTSSL